MLMLAWRSALSLAVRLDLARYYLTLAVFLLAVPATLVVTLYAPIPAVHDALHHVRHSFLNVACH